MRSRFRFLILVGVNPLALSPAKAKASQSPDKETTGPRLPFGLSVEVSAVAVWTFLREPIAITVMASLVGLGLTNCPGRSMGTPLAGWRRAKNVSVRQPPPWNKVRPKGEGEIMNRVEPILLGLGCFGSWADWFSLG
ncbi:hypothetical protein NL676_029799 [Syzygium grande]|nr:hypothetical protein NL676_029799 [Syzygium grande]